MHLEKIPEMRFQSKYPGQPREKPGARPGTNITFLARGVWQLRFLSVSTFSKPRNVSQTQNVVSGTNWREISLLFYEPEIASDPKMYSVVFDHLRPSSVCTCNEIYVFWKF